MARWGLEILVGFEGPDFSACSKTFCSISMVCADADSVVGGTFAVGTARVDDGGAEVLVDCE